MPKLGKREDWDEQELTEAREGWPIRRSDPGFRGASSTAVASEAGHRFRNGEPRTEAPTSGWGLVPRNRRELRKSHAKTEQTTNRRRTTWIHGRAIGSHAETRSLIPNFRRCVQAHVSSDSS